MRAQMRLVRGLAGGVDDQEQMAAEIRHHQVVENAAVGVGELRVALPARRDRQDVLRHQPLQRRAASSTLPDFGCSAIWPICETSNRPAAAAGVQVFPQHAGGVLHRHVIAGERHHLAAARQMQRMQRGAFQR